MSTIDSVLGELKIASPCSQRWEDMTGDERVRLCEQCALHVYNFEEMTRNEVYDLVSRTEGRVCGRFYRRTDGRIVTSDCPVAFDKLKYRLALVAGSLASLATLALGAVLVIARGRTSVDLAKSKPVAKLCEWATGTSSNPYQNVAGGLIAMPQPQPVKLTGKIAVRPMPVATLPKSNP